MKPIPKDDEDSDESGEEEDFSDTEDDDDDAVQWETMVECEASSEWSSHVAAVAARLLQPDCPLADKIGTGWASLRSLFLHKERQEKAARMLRRNTAESQAALAKLGVGGLAQEYRASLEDRRQASIRNVEVQAGRRSITEKKLDVFTPKEEVPDPLARPEHHLLYAQDIAGSVDKTIGGLWHVAHRKGAPLLASPQLDAETVGVLPQGTMVEVLEKHPTLLELPAERVIRQLEALSQSSKSELEVRRHAALLRTPRGWILQRLTTNDAVVLASVPWDSVGGSTGGVDVLRALRRKEVERLLTATADRRVASIVIERCFRRHIVVSRTALRQLAVAEAKAVEGLISVNLSRPIALAPTIALHLEDQSHIVDRGLTQEVHNDAKKGVRFVRPSSAQATRTPRRQSGGLLRKSNGGAAAPISSFARELHAQVSAASAVWTTTEPTSSARGDSLGWLLEKGGSARHMRGFGDSEQAAWQADDPALGLAMATEIAGLTRNPSAPAMAAALRADLATRRHPPRALKANIARLEAGAIEVTTVAGRQALKERQSLSIFRQPKEENVDWSRAARRRRAKAHEGRMAELRRMTGEMDLTLEKDVTRRGTRLSRAECASSATSFAPRPRSPRPNRSGAMPSN